MDGARRGPRAPCMADVAKDYGVLKRERLRGRALVAADVKEREGASTGAVRGADVLGPRG